MTSASGWIRGVIGLAVAGALVIGGLLDREWAWFFIPAVLGGALVAAVLWRRG